MFFDTNVIIKALSKDCELGIFEIVSLHIENKQAYISVVVYAELLSYQGLTEEESLSLKSYLLDNYILVDINMEIAEIASKIVKETRLKTGKKLKMTDALIAAAAIFYKKDLRTLDKEDFDQIKLVYF